MSPIVSFFCSKVSRVSPFSLFSHRVNSLALLAVVFFLHRVIYLALLAVDRLFETLTRVSQRIFRH
jgi:hypothetical protein